MDEKYNENLFSLINVLDSNQSNEQILTSYDDFFPQIESQHLEKVLSKCLPSISEKGDCSLDRTAIIEHIKTFYELDENNSRYLINLALTHLITTYDKIYNPIFSSVFKAILNGIPSQYFNLSVSLIKNINLLQYVQEFYYCHWAITILKEVGANINQLGQLSVPLFILKHPDLTIEEKEARFKHLVSLDIDFSYSYLVSSLFGDYLRNEEYVTNELLVLAEKFDKKPYYYNFKNENPCHDLFDTLTSDNINDTDKKNLDNYVRISLLFKGNLNSYNENFETPAFLLLKNYSEFFFSHYYQVDIGWNKKNFENKYAFDYIPENKLISFINHLYALSPLSLFKPLLNDLSVENHIAFNQFIQHYGLDKKLIKEVPEAQHKALELDYPETFKHTDVNVNIDESDYFVLSAYHEWFASLNPDRKDKIIQHFSTVFNNLFPLEYSEENQPPKVFDPNEEISLRLYTPEALNKLKKEIAANKNENHPKIAEIFLKQIEKDTKFAYRTLAKSDLLLASIDKLYERFPHFSEVLEHLSDYTELQSKGDGVFYIPPMLMAGGPGVGKTFFSHELANILKTYFYVFNMESVSNNGILTGLSDLWHGATPGKIFSALRDEPNMNPILLLDEIDKCGGDERFSPTNALLPLLERYTAKNFKDECIPLEIDASHIVWFATANDLNKVSAPLKSRFDIFNIPSPNFQERKALIKGVYQTILKNNSWGAIFNQEIPDASLDLLASVNTPGAARDLRRNLTIACAKAVKANRNEIHLDDLKMIPKVETMPWDIILETQHITDTTKK